MKKYHKIYVSGHSGLLGSALLRLLEGKGYKNLVLRTSQELDLRNQRATESFFERERPDFVFHAAAKVGGLQANDTYRADFIYDNIMMQSNIIHSAWKNGVKKLLFFGSNCIYPKECPQPMKEEYMLTGRFEPTNQPYAVAKTAGVEMCQAYNSQHQTNFIVAVPASLYGPGDNFDMTHSHIVPTLIRKCHDAKVADKKAIHIPGSEHRVREMIFVDDAANASLFLMQNYNSSKIINVGTNIGHSVKELADFVKEAVSYRGDIVFDSTEPTGMLLKVMDSSKINSLGWTASTNFKEGLKRTYEWFLKNLT